MDQLTQKIHLLIAQHYCVPVDTVSRGQNLGDALGGDSLDFVALVKDIEDDLGISIPDEEVGALTTVGELEDLVSKLVSQLP